MTDQHQQLSVLICDDSNLIRTLLSDLVQRQPDMLVVGVAATGQEGIRRARELQPDVVLMDIHLPDIDGIQAAWQVRASSPRTAVIMATSEERIDFLQHSMAAGAQGYVLKPFGNGQSLLRTIRDVHGRHQARAVPGLIAPGLEAPSRRPQGQRIVVVGSKGGVGRTTVAVGLSLALREQTRSSVLLFDADFTFGDTAVHLDLPTHHSILDLLPRVDALDSQVLAQAVARHASGVQVLLPPPSPVDAERVGVSQAQVILHSAALANDYVVVDTASAYDERTLPLLNLADVLVMVVTPHRGVLRNTARFQQLLAATGNSARTLVVLNRSDALSGLSQQDIRDELGADELLELPSSGAEVTQAANDGRPMATSNGRAPFARALSLLAQRVVALGNASGTLAG